MSGTSPPTGSGSSRYRTLFELAQGGTATVSLAVVRGDEASGRLVVVKQLRPVYVHDADFRAMFMMEGRLSAKLDHPHVARVLDVLEESAPTIVMEYIAGQTLDAVLTLSEPRLPLELHLRILADALSGLHHAHELVDASGAPLEVVHRDVSPSNVMVGYDGVVKVLDFGVAQLAGTSIETEIGVVKGKLRYMPPEQVAGEKVDRRADVFAVGVMLWEALSGSRLWKGLPDAAIVNRVLAGAIPEPRREGEVMCPELTAICRRALTPQRADRYASARQLQEALEDYIARRWPGASAHELSHFMNERFARAREEAAERVQQELARVEGPSTSGRPKLPKRRTTRMIDAAAPKAEPPKEARRSPSWWLALGSVLLGALLFAWGVRAKREKLPSASPPERPAADAAAPLDVAPAREREHGTVATSSIPAASVVPPQVSAPPRSPVPARPQAATAPPPSVETPPVHEDGCEPPYYYVSGIKKFKPECL